MTYIRIHSLQAFILATALSATLGIAEQQQQEARSENRNASTQAKETSNGSDEALRQAIESKLQSDPEVSAHLIDVNTEGGLVTLSGTVDDLLARQRANQVAQSTRGVIEVNNQLRVRPVHRSDAQIERDVRAALAVDPAAESYDVNVTVQNGTVNLEGEVQSYQEKRLAEALASSIRGVRQVRNNIEINFDADRPDAEIEADIRSRLKGDIHTARNNIEVKVNDSRAILSGKVGSAIEKTWAEADAWVFGVTDVNAERLQVDTQAPSRERARTKTSQTLAGNAQNADGKGGINQVESGSAGKNAQSSTESASQPDNAIRRAVERAFISNPRVFSFDTKVAVENGVVTLTGIVDNLRAKQAAERETRDVLGVKRVKNLLKVRPPNRPSDELLEARVNNAIKRTVRLDDDNIHSWVLNGKAYLTGTVDSYSEKILANNAVSGVEGILAVENRLSVPYSLYDEAHEGWWPGAYAWYARNDPSLHKSDRELRQDIEDQMFWSPFVDADEVQVAVTNRVATLTGSVDSSNERRAATKNAYDAGAASVRNNLRIYDNYDGIFDF